MIEPLTLAITATGVLVARRAIESIGRAAVNSEAPVVSLNRALSLLMAGGAIFKVGQTLNTFQQLDNALRTVSSTTEEAAAAQDQLFGVAQRSRSSWEETIQVYTRVKRATADLGVSAGEAIKMTELLNKALTIGGASGQERYSVLIQFTQALASGRLQGDELRSLLENSTVLGNILAKQLGVTRGELRKLGSEGKITSDVLVKAFRNYGNEIEDTFSKTVPTIANSFQLVRNEATKALVELDKTTGASQKLAETLVWVSQNMDAIKKVAVPAAFGLAAGIAAAGAAAGGLLPLISRLAGLLLFNPVVAGILVIAGLVSALYNFRNEITLSTEKLTTLGDLFTVIFSRMQAAINALDVSKITDFLKFDFSGFSLENVLRNTATSIDTLLALMNGLKEGVTQAAKELFLPEIFRNIWVAVIGIWQAGVTALANSFSWLVSTVTALAEQMRVALGQSPASPEVVNGALAAGERIGTAFKKGFEDVMKNKPAQSYMDGLLSEAERAAKERAFQADAAAFGYQFSTPTISNKQNILTTPTNTNTKGAEKLQRELDAVLKKSDTVAAAQRELERAEQVLTKAVAAGQITAQRKVEILEQMRIAMRDNLDPYGEIVRKIQEEQEGLKLTAEQREVNNKLLEYENKLREKGQTLNPERRTELTALLQQTEAMKRQAASIKEAFESAFSSMSDALVDFVMTGKFNFKELADSIIRDLLRIALKRAVVEPLVNGLTSALTGAFNPSGGGNPFPSPINGNPFPTPLAEGGNFRMGQTLLVGEEGPEIMRMSGSGTVYPHGTMPGGAAPMAYAPQPKIQVFPPPGHEVRSEQTTENRQQITKLMIINTVKEGQLKGEFDDTQAQRFRARVPTKRR